MGTKLFQPRVALPESLYQDSVGTQRCQSLEIYNLETVSLAEPLNIYLPEHYMQSYMKNRPAVMQYMKKCPRNCPMIERMMKKFQLVIVLFSYFRPCDGTPQSFFLIQMSSYTCMHVHPCACVCITYVKTKGKFAREHHMV